jgi:hypothetical protein
MRNVLATLLLALLLSTAASQAATLGDERVGFSADRALVIDGRTYTGKIWAMPGEERHEQAIEAFRPIFLLHADRALGELVVPQLKTIAQFRIPAELRFLLGGGGGEAQKHPLGDDTVNGVATTRYAIDRTVPEGHAEGTLWLSRDDIPMKLEGTFTAARNGKVTHVRWELTHVKIGPQPTALFEPPHGYSMLPPEALAPLLGLRLKSAKR